MWLNSCRRAQFCVYGQQFDRFADRFAYRSARNRYLQPRKDQRKRGLQVKWTY